MDVSDQFYNPAALPPPPPRGKASDTLPGIEPRFRGRPARRLVSTTVTGVSDDLHYRVPLPVVFYTCYRCDDQIEEEMHGIAHPTRPDHKCVLRFSREV
jgi:hypothetical protein